MAVEKDALGLKDEDDVVGVGTVGLFRRPRADEFVSFINLQHIRRLSTTATTTTGAKIIASFRYQPSRMKTTATLHLPPRTSPVPRGFCQDGTSGPAGSTPA